MISHARAAVLATCLALLAGAVTVHAAAHKEHAPMELGGFSVSLAVKDIAASRAFYEKLGFTPAGGDESQNWLIMRNGTTNIGLFQGKFEGNILTFNPGWSNLAEELDRFQDVRDIQARLKEAGVPLLLEADPDADGPAHIVMQDPDGNQILLDQHVGKPGS